MGRQVNFYMLAEDLAEFEKAISSKEQVLFVKTRLSTPEIETLETLAVPELGKTLLALYDSLPIECCWPIRGRESRIGRKPRIFLSLICDFLSIRGSALVLNTQRGTTAF